MDIGNKIRNIRKEKRMTLQQIADIMGCFPQLISQYESGKRQPKLETIEKIAIALGCNVSDIREFDASIRVSITPEAKEISRIQNKLLNDRENITEEEIKLHPAISSMLILMCSNITESWISKRMVSR